MKLVLTFLKKIFFRFQPTAYQLNADGKSSVFTLVEKVDSVIGDVNERKVGHNLFDASRLDITGHFGT